MEEQVVETSKIRKRIEDDEEKDYTCSKKTNVEHTFSDDLVLPDEILLKVFAYCQLRDMKTIPLVNQVS